LSLEELEKSFSRFEGGRFVKVGIDFMAFGVLEESLVFFEGLIH